MKKIKNFLYIIGAIVIIVTIFFKNDISDKLDNILWVVSGMWLIIIIILELIKKEK